MNPPTTVPEQEEHLFRVMSSKRFLAQEGLHNEIPVFIYPYDATRQVPVEAATTRVKRRLADAGVRVLEVNLFELSVALLRDEEVFDLVVERESSQPRDHFLEDLRAMLDPREYLVPAIEARVDEQPLAPQVVFLTGVGAIYPIIRSHTILETIHDLARKVPVVLFFPGTYEPASTAGSSLSLFGRLHDDRYYRARDILSQEA